MNEFLETDVLIIGGGISGATAALTLSDAGIKTILITKGKDLSDTNTNQAQGGIATLFNGEKIDSFVSDIMNAGDEINYPPAVNQVVSNSVDLVDNILINKLKVPFSTNSNGFDMAKEGAHSKRRVLNVKDMTGKIIQEQFTSFLTSNNKNIKILYNHTAIDLLTSNHHSTNPLRTYEEPKTLGAYVLDQKRGVIKRIFAKKVILASGGLSSIFLNSTNPSDVVGSGLAMAYRAGARLANLEYVQFHPTSLFKKEGDSFLISEAVRGEGAKLMNGKGEYFMKKYSHLSELAPRDEVSRAIYEEMIRDGLDYVYLDLASFAEIDIKDRFPTIYSKCLEYGINIEEKPIPVVPAAHYSCGGVLSDLRGRSSLANLYAIGEVSSTGVHGANRLASVSLLEGLVWGVKAAEDIIDTFEPGGSNYTISEIPEWKYPSPQENMDPALILQDQITVKHTMWNYSGIIRTSKRLSRAKSDLNYLNHRILKFYHQTEMSNSIINLRDSVQTSLLVVNAAIRNKISRGAHFISDL
ncbi:MAG: FAD-dependent oxidoreductase [Acidobacteriota bacterium]